VLVDFGVEGPALLAGEGIERQDAAERRRQVEGAVDVDRRRLEGGRLGLLRLVGVAGAEGPGDLERLDVAAVDVGERREALAARIVPPGGPVAGGLRRRRGRRLRGEQDRGYDGGGEAEQEGFRDHEVPRRER